MAYEVPHFINGQEIKSSGKALSIYNPATGQIAGKVGVADAALVQKAIQAANTAFPAWSQTPSPQRAEILFRYLALLKEHSDALAKLVTQEHGKTIREALGSIQRGVDVVKYTCGIPHHLQGQFTEEVASGIDVYSLRQALGVCVGITPFNFPAMIPLWMFPMAIACGNTFVLKPSEKDPSCSILLVKLAKLAGVPDGVVNVIHGEKETVDMLITHPDVKAISFVGSSQVAEHVYHTANTKLKRVQAFGGAKNHCVIMPDADVEQTIDALVESAYGSAGERCMALSVATVVGEQFADQLIAKMQPKIVNLKIGVGTDPATEMGPLITEQHWQKVKSYIEIGKQEGAKLVLDGSNYKPKNHEAGFFMGGTLFDQVQPNMRIYQEEIFGPVLSIVRVANIDEALQLINDHPYGNGTAIFTRDGYTARYFAEKVQAGMVGVNVPIPVPVAYHSFGGWKRSIFSDIGMYGSEAVRFYTKLKTVTGRWFPGNLS